MRARSMVIKRRPAGRGTVNVRGFKKEEEKQQWSAEKGGFVSGVGERIRAEREFRSLEDEAKARRKWNDDRPKGKMKGCRTYVEKIVKHPEWPVNLHSMHQALRTWAKFGIVEEIQKCLAILRERSIKADCHLYLELMKALNKRGRLEEAISVYHLMHSRGVKPDIFIKTFLLTKCALERKVDEAEYFEREVLKHKPSAVVVCTLLNSFSKMRNVEKVLAYYNEFEKAGYAKTPWIYASMVDAFNRIGSHDLVDKLFKEATTSTTPLKLNTHLFSAVIDSYAERRNREGMQAVLDYMASRGIRVDDYCMNAILNVYCKCGDVEQAQGVFEAMIREGSKCGWVPMRTLLTMYADLGLAQEAKDFYQQFMVKRGFPARRRTYNLLFRAFANGGDMDNAATYLRRMIREGINPNEETYAHYVVAIANNEQSDWEAVLPAIITMEDKFSLTEVGWHAKIYAMVRHAQDELAIDAVERMFLCQIPLEDELYRKIIKGYVIRGGLHEFASFLAAVSGFTLVNDRTVTQLLASTIEVHGIRIDADNLMEQYRKLKKIADEEVTTDDIDWVVERNMAKQ